MDLQISDTLAGVIFLATWVTVIGVGGCIMYYKLTYDKWLWSELRKLPEIPKKDG